MQIKVAAGPLPNPAAERAALSDLLDRTSHLLRLLAKQLLPLDAGDIESIRRSAQNGYSAGPPCAAGDLGRERHPEPPIRLVGTGSFRTCRKKTGGSRLLFADVLVG
jgi:hypothetical protein